MTMDTHSSKRMVLAGVFAALGLVLVFPGGCSHDSGSDAVGQIEPCSPDTAEQVEPFGIDYSKTIHESLTDDRALRRMFLVGSVTDGAGGEGYSGNLNLILDKVGEERFLKVLASVAYDIQESVLGNICYDAGLDQDIPGLQGKFAKRYPNLWNRMIRDPVLRVRMFGDGDHPRTP